MSITGSAAPLSDDDGLVIRHSSFFDTVVLKTSALEVASWIVDPMFAARETSISHQMPSSSIPSMQLHESDGHDPDALGILDGISKAQE